MDALDWTGLFGAVIGLITAVTIYLRKKAEPTSPPSKPQGGNSMNITSGGSTTIGGKAIVGDNTEVTDGHKE